VSSHMAAWTSIEAAAGLTPDRILPPAAPSWPAIQDLEPNTPCSNAGTSAPSGQRQSTAPDRRPYRAPHTDESGSAQGADRALLRAFSKIAFGFARSGAAQSPAFDE